MYGQPREEYGPQLVVASHPGEAEGALFNLITIQAPARHSEPTQPANQTGYQQTSRRHTTNICSGQGTAHKLGRVQPVYQHDNWLSRLLQLAKIMQEDHSEL
jgi:hypothetical protein